MTNALNGVTALTHLGVIAVEGDDAASFLQGQLTQDFALLGSGEARLAAYCTAKGRMLASFIGFKPAPTLKRLSMYVLRAKAKLRDATSEFDLCGLAGSAAGPTTQPWKLAIDGESAVIALYPADGQRRALRISPAGSARPEGELLDDSLWSWGDVRSGVATITAPIVEAFVPQMLNYESVGGVNFKKGCYPGQEVVARSQFRGTLKRRAYLAHASQELAVGQELFHESDAEQPCGIVAQSAAAPGGGWDAIVSITIASAQAGKITAGSAQGADVQVFAAPYPLLADV
jgi:tRNA-modifying protein YgfZ